MDAVLVEASKTVVNKELSDVTDLHHIYCILFGVTFKQIAQTPHRRHFVL